MNYLICKFAHHCERFARLSGAGAKITFVCEGGFGMPLMDALAYNYIADHRNIPHANNAVSDKVDICY